jgi:hypothetical protein
VNKKVYSIYKYLPKYICRIISTIKKTNIGVTQLPDKAPPSMRLCTSYWIATYRARAAA